MVIMLWRVTDAKWLILRLDEYMYMYNCIYYMSTVSFGVIIMTCVNGGFLNYYYAFEV